MARTIDARDLSARYACIDSDGRELIACGVADGELSRDEQGQLGFGYDPIFYDPSEHATYGEISDEEKNKISHRAKAVNQLMEMIRQQYTQFVIAPEVWHNGSHRDVAQLDRALGLGPRGRRFNSCRPDHFSVRPWSNG